MRILFLFVLYIIVCLDLSAGVLPRSEYPRPQFVRNEWINLNGEWSYEFDFGESGTQRDFQKSNGFSNKIQVPFCPESKLSGVQYKDFIKCMWYQRMINIPLGWNEKNIYLNFGAVDYRADIYLNGLFIQRHYGGSSSFSIDITRFVQPGNEYSLVVCVSDDLRSGKQTGGKQSPSFYSSGCLYTRVTGIWQTVWMEAIDKQGLKSAVLRPDIDQNQLLILPEFIQESGNKLEVTLKEKGKILIRKETTCTNSTVILLPIKNMKLWSPESPFLYDLIYRVRNHKGEVIDEVRSYVGMRKIHTEAGKFFLNNKPYFLRLVLDQGYYADGIWTAPSDEALCRDIQLGKEAGFNGARLHQKVFEERYHYWADKLGYLTWGESASWGMNHDDELSARNFIAEWSEIITRDRNHPSIIAWTPFNETWGAGKVVYPRLVRDIYHITKVIDPTRPINDASGDKHILTDIWGVHNYQQDPNILADALVYRKGEEPYRNISDDKTLAVYEGQPYVVSEFGGIGWMNPEDHGSSWGYGSIPEAQEDFYKRLEGLVKAIRRSDIVSGFCYTQLTDVEQEKNGIYYYNRTPKFDMKRIKEIFEFVP